MKITCTRCEGLKDPLGIDVAKPRLSYALESPERGQCQTAYQIVTRSGERVLWDSGRVTSPQSTHIPWDGPPLVSRQEVRWIVRVWDRDGVVSDWSAPSSFEMGLLDPQDWRAKWIAAVPNLTTELQTPPAPLLRRGFTLDKPVQSARAYVCGQCYTAFKRYVDHVGAHDYLKESPSGWLGDWVALDAKTPEAVTHAGFHAADARIVAATARMLGREEEARHYAQIAAEVATRFSQHYLDTTTGIVATGTQTAQSTALYQNLVDESTRPQVISKLLEAIEQNAGRLNVGVLGAKSVPWALTAAGRADLFYAMLTSQEFPSWGHWLKEGATTLWEDWHGKASRNHIFSGDISAWFYRVLAGINPDEAAPGFEHIHFRPEILGDLSWVKAEIRTPRGLVASFWRRTSEALTWQIVVPPGSHASVHVPVSTHEMVTRDGGELIAEEDRRQTFAVDSGTYEFVVRVRGD